MITVSKTATLSTDASGDQEIELTELKKVHRVLRIGVDEKGYYGNLHSLSGRTVTVRVYEGGGAGTELASVDSETDGDVNVTVVAEGY